jgi:hypothetical protein
MVVMGHELPKPLQLSTSGIEHDHRGGVQDFLPIRAPPTKSGTGLPTAM